MRTRSAVAALKMDLKALSHTAWAVVFAYPSFAVQKHSIRCEIPASHDGGNNLATPQITSGEVAGITSFCSHPILDNEGEFRLMQQETDEQLAAPGVSSLDGDGWNLDERIRNSSLIAQCLIGKDGCVKSINPNGKRRKMRAYRSILPMVGRVCLDRNLLRGTGTGLELVMENAS